MGGGGLYEGSLLLAVLRKSIRARGISDITIGQRRNMCYCHLELGVVGRWNNRLPLAIGGTTVSVSGVSLIPYWQQENKYKCPNRCSQLRYRASTIPTTGTLAPVRDYSVLVGRGRNKILAHTSENCGNEKSAEMGVQN